MRPLLFDELLLLGLIDAASLDARVVLLRRRLFPPTLELDKEPQ